MRIRPLFCLTVLASIPLSAFAQDSSTSAHSQWSTEKADTWLEKHGWLVGCNYIPSSAVNELEMWQADTFDPKTIDRELGWAEGLGFNSVRVFLHSLLWEQDSKGFLERMDQFLSLAAKHHIGVVFVPLDSCWDPKPALGKQRAPTPFVHNSGWVQSPGVDVLMDPAKRDALKPYIVGVIDRFRDDPRIDAWDLFNEPDNGGGGNYAVPPGKSEAALSLLEKAFTWAREVGPSQPLTSAPWVGTFGDPDKLAPVPRFQLDHSDVISFHCYGKLDELKKCVENLKRYHRPIVCSEYMARPQGSTFDPNLGYMKSEKVGAFNWGFVSGKSQTIFPWDSWKKQYQSEPPLWFHDIFHTDGAPYKPEEVEYIKKVTGKS